MNNVLISEENFASCLKDDCEYELLAGIKKLIISISEDINAQADEPFPSIEEFMTNVSIFKF